MLIRQQLDNKFDFLNCKNEKSKCCHIPSPWNNIVLYLTRANSFVYFVSTQIIVLECNQQHTFVSLFVFYRYFKKFLTWKQVISCRLFLLANIVANLNQWLISPASKTHSDKICSKCFRKAISKYIYMKSFGRH